MLGVRYVYYLDCGDGNGCLHRYIHQAACITCVVLCISMKLFTKNKETASHVVKNKKPN